MPTHHPRTLAFLGVLEELEELHLRKGADYGRDDDPFANITVSEQWGIPPWLGAIMRGTDKVVRLQSYVRTGTLANEGAEDALADLAAYAIIALVLLREELPAPPEAEESDEDPITEENPYVTPHVSVPTAPRVPYWSPEDIDAATAQLGRKIDPRWVGWTAGLQPY